MAYMNQERKAKIRTALKQVVPADWKWTLGVHHHSTIVFNLKSAPVDLLGHIATVRASRWPAADEPDAPVKQGYWDVNHYYLDTQFAGDVLETFQKIDAALNDGNHDNSDIQTDYFDVGWYVDINIGRWDKHFEVK